MGMFDSVYTELTCPFCGYQYKYTPPSYAEAKKSLDKYHDNLVKDAKEPRSKWSDFQFFGKSPDEIKVLIEHSNSDEAIQKYIDGKYWGLAEVQTKDWECSLESFFVGDLVEYARYGHYFIPSMIFCKGCCVDKNGQPNGHVNVWIEMDNHIIKNVLTKNPETGEPERETW